MHSIAPFSEEMFLSISIDCFCKCIFYQKTEIENGNKISVLKTKIQNFNMTIMHDVFIKSTVMFYGLQCT